MKNLLILLTIAQAGCTVNMPLDETSLLGHQKYMLNKEAERFPNGTPASCRSLKEIYKYEQNAKATSDALFGVSLLLGTVNIVATDVGLPFEQDGSQSRGKARIDGITDTSYRDWKNYNADHLYRGATHYGVQMTNAVLTPRTDKQIKPRCIDL